MCILLHKIIRCQDEKLLEAEVQESKMLADTNQRNDIVKEVIDVIMSGPGTKYK